MGKKHYSNNKLIIDLIKNYFVFEYRKNIKVMIQLLL